MNLGDRAGLEPAPSRVEDERTIPSCCRSILWSAEQDSNLRHLVPETSALIH